MSDRMADATARALGATVREFRTVQQMLLWFTAQRQRRLGRAIALGDGGCPRPQCEIDIAEATYASVAACLVARHPADDVDLPLAFAREPEAARLEAERRVTLLAAWCSGSTERGKVRVIDELMADTGMGAVACERYVRHAERVIRRRAVAAGLVEGRERAAEGGEG